MTEVTIFTRIVSFIHNLFAEGEDIAADGFKAFIAEIEAGGGTVLLSIVDGIVASLAVESNSPAEKFQLALTAAKTALVDKGLPVIENAVQGAILVSVAKLHADQAASAKAEADAQAAMLAEDAANTGVPAAELTQDTAPEGAGTEPVAFPVDGATAA